MKLDIHYLLSDKYAKWIGFVLIVLFLGLIIGEFFSLRHSSVPVTTIPEKNIPVSTKQDSFNAILTSSLFGVYVSNDLNVRSVKQSLLNVTLVGILFSGNIDDSQVIIRYANAEEKTYGLGDTIPGDALIKRIMATGVLVERQGALESLSLPQDVLTFIPVAEPLREE
ncbi:type II secretion system protein N [Legionella sp.]|uniref:type II secretion system protein N n=1 Tax=Legionella sp. TaxID=459 RepID=UPI003CAA3B8E